MSATQVDLRSIDWASVRTAAYRVRQHYRYAYTAPVRNVRQRLMMVPPDQHADQRLLDFRLDVRGAQEEARLEWGTDPFGNRVCCVEIEHVEHALDFEAVFHVTRTRSGAELEEALPPEQWSALLHETALTAPDARVWSAAHDIARQTHSPRQRAELALEWSASAIEYEVGATGVQTPASLALHLGRGVCQDYAHIMLSLLRALGLACRYVSGHLLGEGAPHAWVEALLVDPRTARARVVAYDPTHRRPAGLDYVTVATGRDYADVTMTSGVFSGPAQGRLHWSKQADVIALTGAQQRAEAESAA